MFSLNLNFFGAPKTTLQLASKERSKIPLNYRLLVILDQLQNADVEMFQKKMLSWVETLQHMRKYTVKNLRKTNCGKILNTDG